MKGKNETMKLIKKLMVVLVAVFMVMSLTSKVDAAEIDVQDVLDGETYTAYIDNQEVGSVTISDSTNYINMNGNMGMFGPQLNDQMFEGNPGEFGNPPEGDMQHQGGGPRR